jgi:5,10-methylenetetrahydromethanopterin reductase
MRFSLRLNNDLTPSLYVALAQAAEKFGFHQFWVSHDLFLHSAPVLLTHIAGNTSRIEIGTCILNPYTLHPAEIAMLATTLDQVSGGRFNLGLAAGARDFLEWVGIRPAHPLAAVRATIDALRALWRGDPVPTAGSFIRWTENAYLRIPASRVIPIYLGALSPNMLELSGERADGVLPLLFPPEHYYTVKPYIERGLARRATSVLSGDIPTRAPPHPPDAAPASVAPFDFAACVWVSLASDRAAARHVLAKKIAYYGHALSPLIWERLGVTQQDFEPITHALTVERDERRATAMVTDPMLAIGIVGDAADVIRRLEPLVASGARHLSFGPPLGPDPLAAIELLGTRVLPHFRQSPE